MSPSAIELEFLSLSTIDILPGRNELLMQNEYVNFKVNIEL